jgi:hypothetical protein
MPSRCRRRSRYGSAARLRTNPSAVTYGFWTSWFEAHRLELGRERHLLQRELDLVRLHEHVQDVEGDGGVHDHGAAAQDAVKPSVVEVQHPQLLWVFPLRDQGEPSLRSAREVRSRLRFLSLD